MPLFSLFVYTSLLTIVVLLVYKKLEPVPSVSIFNYSEPTLYISFRYFIALAAIAFVVAIRYNVGTDWLAYKRYFESGFFYAKSIEPGYGLVNHIVWLSGGTFIHLSFVVSFISWYFIFKSMHKELLALTILIIFCDEWFFTSTNLVRQFLALSIFFYSIQYLVREKKLAYIILIVIAGLFHQTALLLLPIVLLPKKNMYNRTIWIALFIVSYLYKQNDYFLQSLPKLFGHIGDYFSSYSTYTNYFYSKFYDVSEISIINYGVQFRTFMALYIIFCARRVINNVPESAMLYYIFFLGSIFDNLFVGVTIVSRFTMYFTVLRAPLLALTIVHDLKFMRKPLVAYSHGIILMLYILLFLYTGSNYSYRYSF